MRREIQTTFSCSARGGRDMSRALADIESKVRKVRDYRVCFHPEAPRGCSAQIIASHTVQRCGGGLSAIAQQNHVYGCLPNMIQLGRTSGFVELTRFGR